MRFKTKCLSLAAACLSLTMFGLACSNSSVNETGSTAPAGTAGATKFKDGGAPPTTYKDFYLREQNVGKSQAKGGTAAPGGEAPKGAEAPKGGEAPKP
jgi:hypothetical protein